MSTTKKGSAPAAEGGAPQRTSEPGRLETGLDLLNAGAPVVGTGLLFVGTVAQYDAGWLGAVVAAVLCLVAMPIATVVTPKLARRARFLGLVMGVVSALAIWLTIVFSIDPK